MTEKCERCGKEAPYTICYGTELICQDCLNIATGRKKVEAKESLEDMLFGDQHIEHKCHRCGNEGDLIVDYTIRDTGDQVWICQSCKAEKEEEQTARAERNRQKVEQERRFDSFWS